MPKNENVITILFIGEDINDYLLIKELLNSARKKYSVCWQVNHKEALYQLLDDQFNVCLLNHQFDALPELDILKESKIKGCKIPIILLIGQADWEMDPAYIQTGVIDYLEKSKLDSSLLERSIRYALEHKRTQEQVQYLSHYDPLTQLPNRTFFMDRLQSAIATAQRYKRLLAVLFVDLDNFKKINDSYGHKIGDQMLLETAKRLSSNLRKEDSISKAESNGSINTISRLGGDEFIIMLSEIVEIENASAIAKRLLLSIAGPYKIESNEIHITASIGIAIFPMDGIDKESLIKNADIAMYTAKGHGKNNYQYFNHYMTVDVLNKLNLEHELYTALDQNQFILYYQPQILLSTKSIIGIEALIRWKHPQAGIIGPDDFLPFAHEYGIISDIDTWVIQKVCRDWQSKLQNKKNKLTLSINIAVTNLYKTEFVDMLLQTTKEFAIPPENISIEISETHLFQNITKALNGMERLREHGFRFSIDDFGMNNASFYHLKHVPLLDCIKINSLFIRNIPDDHRDKTIVTSLIDIAHSFHCLVIAEGVENSQQEEFLENQHCDIAQGFFYYKPQEQKDLTFLVTQS